MEPFEILEELGKGGMGVVYRARQAHLDRDIALKLIRERSQEDRELLRRFRREAATLSRLSHPNIVRLLDFGIHDGHYFLAMELIDGISVDRLIQVRPAEARQLGDVIVLAMLDALAAVHEAELVHRDLKTGNIMLRRDGTPLLTDFGLVRNIGHEVTAITEAGLLVGTPSFISPECFAGEEAGAAADMWALGCVYFHLASGSSPFERPTLKETMEAVIRGDVPDLPTCCPDLDAPRRDFLASLLAVDPEERIRDGILGFELFSSILDRGHGGPRTRRTRALLLPGTAPAPVTSPTTPPRVASVPRSRFAPGRRLLTTGLLLIPALISFVIFITTSGAPPAPALASATPAPPTGSPAANTPGDRVLQSYRRLQKIWPGFAMTEIHREYAAIASLENDPARERRSTALFVKIGKSVPLPLAKKLRELRYLRPRVCERWSIRGDPSVFEELEGEVADVLEEQLDTLSDWTYLRVNLDGVELVSRHLVNRRTARSARGPSLEQLRMLALNLLFADPVLMEENGVEILELLATPKRADRIILDFGDADPELARVKAIELDRRLLAIHAQRAGGAPPPDPRHLAALIGLEAYRRLEGLVPGFHPPPEIERFVEVSRETDPVIQETKAGELMRFLGRRMDPPSARRVIELGYLSPGLVLRWEVPVSMTSNPIGENESDPFRLMVSDSIESMKDVTYITLNIEAFEKTVQALTLMESGKSIPRGLSLTDIRNFVFHLFLIDPALLQRRGDEISGIVRLPVGDGPTPVLDLRSFDPTILTPKLRQVLSALRLHYRSDPPSDSR